MATKTVANLFIDDTSSEVLDELYRATKEYTRNRKEAQKIIKNLIKMVVKLGVLYRNGQFSNEELLIVERFRKKVHTLAMTAVSFHQIDFTFDRRVMSSLLNDCRELLHQAINRHLTAKSHARVNHVFNHFSDCDFLAALYSPSEVYRVHLQRICDGLNKMLDEGNLWPHSWFCLTELLSSVGFLLYVNIFTFIYIYFLFFIQSSFWFIAHLLVELHSCFYHNIATQSVKSLNEQEYDPDNKHSLVSGRIIQGY